VIKPKSESTEDKEDKIQHSGHQTRKQVVNNRQETHEKRKIEKSQLSRMSKAPREHFSNVQYSG